MQTTHIRQLTSQPCNWRERETEVSKTDVVVGYQFGRGRSDHIVHLMGMSCVVDSISLLECDNSSRDLVGGKKTSL